MVVTGFRIYANVGGNNSIFSEMNFRYLASLLALCFLYSCGSRKRENIESLLQTWSGKEILFPANPTFVIQGKDTVDFSMFGKFKILTYVDSIGCVSCKLQLGKWKTLMEEMNNAEGDSVRFLFFFSPEKRRDFLGTLKSDNFIYPICIDDENRLNKLNHFPSNDAAFHTFLLDKDNKVLAIGNPIHNPKIKELYIKIVRGERIELENESKEIKTEVATDKASISLGSFDWQEEQKVVFTLKNIGDKPLIIQDVNTSCGCTSVNYSKEPIQPHGEIALEVVYKADHPEHFSKTITVYCNTESSPIKLSISGNAE